MRKILKDKKGIALATTVLVLVVIILISSCLLMIASYAMRHANAMSGRQQAYFTARSAALEFKDYLSRNNVTSNLRDGWTTEGRVELQTAPGVTDETFGTFKITLDSLGNNNWRIISTGYFGHGTWQERNSAIVYVMADEIHSASPKNRNMVLASSISDSDGGGVRAAPQYFKSTTFLTLEDYCNNKYHTNYQIGNSGGYTIPYSYYSEYMSSYDGADSNLADSMTHLYSKEGTDIDLQSSYYSGYLISNGDLSVVGVGASCYGIRTIGNFTMKSAGSNFRVYGDVYVSGDLYMDGASTSQIYGDIYVGGACHIENTYVYGNIYACGYNEKDTGTWNPTGNIIGGDLNINVVNQYGHAPGSLRINEAQVGRFLKDRNNTTIPRDKTNAVVWCAKYLNPSGQNNNEWHNFSNYNYSTNATYGDFDYLHIRPIDSAEMETFRNTLDQKLHDDVLGAGSEVTVNDKSDYVDDGNPANNTLANTPAELTYDAATHSIMVTDSGYLESSVEGNGFGGYKPITQCAQYTSGKFINCPTTDGNLHNLFYNYSYGTNNNRCVLVIDASEKDIDIYLKPNQVIEMQEAGFSSQTFTSIAVYGDHAVRFILGEGSTFKLQMNPHGVYKIDDLTTKQAVFPRVREAGEEDPYMLQDTADEPRFYLMSYANNVKVDVNDSTFVGYILLPNTDTNSTVALQVRNQGRRFYGCVYASNFVFNGSGNIDRDTFFCFIPPSEEVFNSNLKATGWISIKAMEGYVSSDTPLDEQANGSFMNTDMFKKGVKITRSKFGASNTDVQGNVSVGTRFFTFA